MNVTVTNDERNCYQSTCRMNVTGILMNVTVMDERNLGYFWCNILKKPIIIYGVRVVNKSKIFRDIFELWLVHFFVTSNPIISPHDLQFI